MGGVRHVQQRTPYHDIRVAKANVRRTAKRQTKRARPGAKRNAGLPAVRQPGNPSTGKKEKAAKGLGHLLSPKGIQETLKTVGSLRTSVKQWLQYLQQADQILDTIFITSSSLKETGVLEKIVKQKGKNLSTEDFTNILIALMNTPIGGQLLKSGGSTETQPPESGSP
jgi:hypothetical protein